jgi:hypothetical protein
LKLLHTNPTKPNIDKPTMTKFILPLAAVFCLINVSCSSSVTDSTGRHYSHSVTPIGSKTGLGYTDARPAIGSEPAGKRRYHQSPTPIMSKTGVAYSYVR